MKNINQGAMYFEKEHRTVRFAEINILGLRAI